LATTKEEEKFNDNFFTDNSYIANFLKKRSKERMLGKANT
jgi:hypothetical protein